MGRPLLLGDELDKQVRDHIIFLRDNGSVVNTAIVMGTAVGLVSHEDANLLACNGGHFTITKPWAKSLLKRMGFVKCKAGTKAKVSIEDFQEQKEQFLINIKAVVTMEDIPIDLIINWDQTGMHYVHGLWLKKDQGGLKFVVSMTRSKSLPFLATL